ncbi:MAG: ArsC/Spx/MgsR family protein [Steroidobacteraceae bacterium]
MGLGDSALTDDQLLDAMMAHPILINRPFVVTPKGTRLCRPGGEGSRTPARAGYSLSSCKGKQAQVLKSGTIQLSPALLSARLLRRTFSAWPSSSLVGSSTYGTRGMPARMHFIRAVGRQVRPAVPSGRPPRRWSADLRARAIAAVRPAKRDRRPRAPPHSQASPARRASCRAVASAWRARTHALRGAQLRRLARFEGNARQPP